MLLSKLPLYIGNKINLEVRIKGSTFVEPKEII